MYKLKLHIIMVLTTALALYTDGFGAVALTNPAPTKPLNAPMEGELPTNPLDVPMRDGAFTISGVSETSFNKSTLEIHFLLEGYEFALDKNEVILSVNGVKSVVSDLSVSAEKISASLKLKDGKNLIKFEAYDSIGRSIYKDMTLWSGPNTVEVVVVDEKGAPYMKPVNLKISLIDDDPEIHSSGTTTNGSLIFSNIPGRTLKVDAHDDNNFIGGTIEKGTVRKIVVKMLGFKPANNIKNNDFSHGKLGWVGEAPTVIVPHEEKTILPPVPSQSKK